MSTDKPTSVLADYYAHRARVRRRLFKIVAIPLLCAIFCAVIWMSWIAWTIHRQNERMEYLTGLGAKLETTPAWPHDYIVELLGKDFADGCVDLTFVDLTDTAAGDDALEWVRDSSELTVLWLGNTQVTDEGLRQIESLHALVNLDLSDTRLTDSGLKSLSQLTNLMRLDLTNTRVTDAGVRHLSGLTTLTHLYLSGTLVTGRALFHVSQLSALQELRLVNCPVTEHGIPNLYDLEHLKMLDLRGTNIRCFLVYPLEKRRVHIRLPKGQSCLELYRELQELTRAIEQDDRNAEAFQRLGFVNSGLGEHEAAIADFLRALELGIDTAELRNELANACSYVGRDDDAIVHFSAAILHNPKQIVYLLNRGLTYDKMGRFHDAIADFSAAIEIEPDDFRLYAFRYEAYKSLGETDSARRDARSAHRLNQDWTTPDLSGEP